MKNLLITFVTLIAAFALTYYVLLNLFETQNSISSFKNSSKTTVNTSSNSESFTESDTTTDETESDEDMFPEDIDDILSNVDEWQIYFDENIQLSSDFIPLNSDAEEIDKDEFIEQLATGEFVPVKLLTGEAMYQLYPLDDSDEHQKISELISSVSDSASNSIAREGTPLPRYNFVDLNDNKYNKDNTNGKILIVTCWSVNSKASTKELPKLNDLFDKYEAYEDVIFLSLSDNSPSDVKKFLTKKTFRFPVVANQSNYIKNKLGTTQYPTHLIIDEEGNIERMLNSADELIAAVEVIATGDFDSL
ncbi:TlpA family protein disulfide reductase [Tenacibaculum sp. M341]|uniref:TlpA family protein disulfide reductase n=1 Tax=Tenacibaculum sp. M341 TaxID=2530339 RepID=UPI001046570C|nr:TlpA disulfide reductase family protein [Tenacibaculum sp. M341]TCI94371.1 redoxin domain-containing protein [Tenacibaculum sp. M341]